MKDINFLKHRVICMLIPLLFIIIGITYGFVTGFRFDIDFKGGTKIEVDLNTEFNNSDVETIVKNVTGHSPLVQKMSSGKSSVSITTEVIDESTSQKVVDSLKEKYPSMAEPSTRNVQPSYGNEMLQSALLAITVAVVLILLYIGIRFRTLGFTAAVTAVIGLIIDALFIIAFYGVTKLPINATFVAVILTILGYSINDTIIVYDRIRENKKKIALSTDVKETINTSIGQTMRRTLYTSITTIVAILIVYIFAFYYNQTVLKEFSLPLVIGILEGTFSSIFIASSLWYTFDKLNNKYKSKNSTKTKKAKA